ncbi:hypothetical protein THAOC_33192, partial [Thalassiosira oceanica]
QYWHRSVVLVTDVADDPARGEAEDDGVPDGELAGGDGRGRWGHRGLMLNRLAGARLSAVRGSGGGEETSAAAEGDDWPVLRGGDLRGLDSSDPSLVCLLRAPPDLRALDVPSTPIVGPLSLIGLDGARSLVSDGICDADDLAVLAGRCAWRPGQLAREMGGDRAEWIAASVDGSTVWESIVGMRSALDGAGGGGDLRGSASDRLLEAGSGMWSSLLSMIGVDESDAVSRLSAGRLGFYDEMLRAWYREKVRADRGPGRDDGTEEDGPARDSSGLIRPGAVVRSTRPPPDDVLLYDAEFARCVVLVLDESETATVGVLLDHAMAAALDVVDGSDPLPLRYGGPVGWSAYRDGSWRDPHDGGGDDGGEEEMYEGFLEYAGDDVAADSPSSEYSSGGADDEDDEDDSAFLWIARTSSLAPTVRRVPIGDSGLSSMREDDAVDAVQSGLLSPDDVAVYSGVCIWEKSDGMGSVGGGLREQIDALGAMEVVPPSPAGPGGGDAVPAALAAFGPVLRQSVLTEGSLERNAALSDEAWRGDGAAAGRGGRTTEAGGWRAWCRGRGPRGSCFRTRSSGSSSTDGGAERESVSSRTFAPAKALPTVGH